MLLTAAATVAGGQRSRAIFNDLCASMRRGREAAEGELTKPVDKAEESRQWALVCRLVAVVARLAAWEATALEGTSLARDRHDVAVTTRC
jgi:hypothetical protein